MTNRTALKTRIHQGVEDVGFGRARRPERPGASGPAIQQGTAFVSASDNFDDCQPPVLTWHGPPPSSFVVRVNVGLALALRFGRRLLGILPDFFCRCEMSIIEESVGSAGINGRNWKKTSGSNLWGCLRRGGIVQSSKGGWVVWGTRKLKSSLGR